MQIAIIEIVTPTRVAADCDAPALGVEPQAERARMVFHRNGVHLQSRAGLEAVPSFHRPFVEAGLELLHRHSGRHPVHR